ncbi:MAG: Rieske (2Fe-2S) protein [Sumerlaeia bacterium]
MSFFKDLLAKFQLGPGQTGSRDDLARDVMAESDALAPASGGGERVVAKAADVPEEGRGGLRVELPTGEAVAIFRQGGHFFAVSATCPHQDGPLEDGAVAIEDGVPVVICPWHGWMFRLEDGRMPLGAGKVGCYPVAERGGDIVLLPGGR